MVCKAECFTKTEAYRSGHNEAVLKTVWVQAHRGSNPLASAKTKGHLQRCPFVLAESSWDIVTRQLVAVVRI